MKVAYTDPAAQELEDILQFIAAEFPVALKPFRQRLRAIERRIAQWPESAPRVPARPEVRMVSMARYPYKIFYRVTGGIIEVLHIHHAARREPPL